MACPLADTPVAGAPRRRYNREDISKMLGSNWAVSVLFGIMAAMDQTQRAAAPRSEAQILGAFVKALALRELTHRQRTTHHTKNPANRIRRQGGATR